MDRPAVSTMIAFAEGIGHDLFDVEDRPGGRSSSSMIAVISPWLRSHASAPLTRPNPRE